MEKQNISLELLKLGKNFTILYVEDEEKIRSQMKLFFEKIFKKVYLGVNGEDGLRLFKENKIDIIITDIDMPIMNGLEMSRIIREHSYDIPIGVISAFEDTLRFSSAIEVGITKYILKPIKKDSVISALYDMTKNLQNKVDARKHHKYLQNKKLANSVKKTAKYFLQNIPSPVFVVDENKKIIYYNDLLNKMFLQKNIKINSKDNINKLNSIFAFENGEKISINNIDDNSKDNKLIYNDEQITLYFSARKQKIDIPEINGFNYLYILNDITTQVKQIRIIEYQKHKIKINKEILEDFLNKRVFSISKETQIEAQKIIKKSEFIENEDLLRRTHIYKISASEYIDTLSDTIEDDLSELNELELDIQSELYEFEYSQQYETLSKISNMFTSYAKTLIRLIEFSDLADGVEVTASYIRTIEQTQVDKYTYIIKTVLQSILDDLSKWRENVFVTLTTNDIHYLDSSLYDTVLELKKVFEGSQEDNQEDNDIEFF